MVMRWNNTWENRTTPCGCIQHARTLAKQIPAKDHPTTFESLTNINQPLNNVLEQIEGCRQCSQDHTLVDTVVAMSEDILHLCYAACSTYRLVDSDSGLENNNNNHHINNITNNTTSQKQPPALSSTGLPTITTTTFTTSALPILTPTTSPSSSSSSSTTTTSLSSLSSSSTFFAKSPMTLGDLELDDEEAGLLARQIIYTILTNLSALLRSVYNNRDSSSMDPTWLSSSSSLPSLYGREVDMPVGRTLSRVLALLGKLFSE